VEVMSKTQRPIPATPAHDEIFCQLELMLDSPDFHASPQQIAFLKYVVNQTLSGKAHAIKGYTVATEVFGRRSDFDQSIDPIVSVQASQLRRAMERYYLTAGQHDSIRIDIPKGTYVPAFHEQHPRHQDSVAEQTAKISVMETWPTVVVRPLANLTAKTEDNYLAIGLTTELAHALSHYKEIRVLEALHRDPALPPPDADIDFVIDGSVRRDPAGFKVAIRFSDAKRCIQIWSGKYQGSFEAAKMIAFQEDVAAQVAVRIAGDNAVIKKHLSGVSVNKVTHNLTTYEAMLRFWESDSLLTPQVMERAIRALEHAVAQEPDYGQTWSMLAAQYADNYSLELIDRATPLEKAVEFACRGVSLDPTNRRARMILAYVRFMQNRLQDARHEAQAAYSLCPDSLLFLDGIGWLMAMAGGWERGVEWVEKAIKLNPYYRPWVRHAVFYNWFRLGNYEKAYQESLKFMLPELFWDQLLKASVCGHLGRIEEGQGYVQILLALKPGFTRRGRILIEKYIKYEDLFDRTVEGLDKLGLRIAK